MFCNYCGAPNPEDAAFCYKCGKAVCRLSANVPVEEKVVPCVAPTGPPHAAAIATPAPENSRDAVSPDKTRTLTGHTLPISSLAFSADGRWLASGSLDNTAKLWNLIDSRQVRTFAGKFPVTCVEFSPEGRQLVIAANNDSPSEGAKSAAHSITIWDFARPDEVRNLAGHEGKLFFVKFSPDGRLLASTDGAAAIHLWDVASGQVIKVFKHGWLRSKLLGGDRGSSLAFTPDGRFLASRSWPVTLWELSSGKEARVFGPESVSLHVAMFIGFTPDGLFLVEARASGKIRIWDVASGKEARCLADPPARSGVSSGLHCAALSSDGKFLAAATYSSAETPREKVTLWDVAAGRTLGTVACNDSGDALAFSPDDQWLAIGDMEYGRREPLGKIRLWRTSEIR